MTVQHDDLDGLLRRVTPQAVAAVARGRSSGLADAEDAVQEALLLASEHWPRDGVPTNPLGWVIRAASRRLVDLDRAAASRRRREALSAARSVVAPVTPSGSDDSLLLLVLCCPPDLTPGAAIPLALRAVAGLTTREIAAAFLVPEATMAQRISRAKAKLREADEPFRMPPPDQLDARLRLVLHMLYLLFNEGYTATEGEALVRIDLSSEAIRLTRQAHVARPDHAETTGLLALMLLTDARRPARVGPTGELVPLDEQDRSLWDRAAIAEGLALVAASAHEPAGEYALQARVAAAHARAARYEDTDWDQVVAAYADLVALTDNPMARLNHAVAVAMKDGPAAGLALLDALDDVLGSSHRLAAVRGHLLERVGEPEAAAAALRDAASRTTNLRERAYLLTHAARLQPPPDDRTGPAAGG